ncbi:MAG: hypothetical protein U0271_44390 [Polyangiaceae bacterium]
MHLLAGCAATPDPRVALLEARVGALEAELAYVRTTALASTAQVQPVATVDPNSLVNEVRFELGATEFFGGDSIEITSVKADRSQFELGGTYEVRGRYKLVTRDAATLLLSVTATDTGGGRSPSDPSSSRVLGRGEGEFVLHTTLTYFGKPHLTFYGVENGRPFGGVYFGLGEWLLTEKTWPYDPPPSEDVGAAPAFARR